MYSGHKCVICKKRISAKKRCCSEQCRNVYAGRISAKLRKKRFWAVCKLCMCKFTVSKSRLQRVKYCSRACLARATIAKP
jgi:predicted nucleic acid-binding Zn ribbon protein